MRAAIIARNFKFEWIFLLVLVRENFSDFELLLGIYEKILGWRGTKRALFGAQKNLWQGFWSGSLTRNLSPGTIGRNQRKSQIVD